MRVLNQIRKFLNIAFALFTCLTFAMIVFYRTSGVFGGLMWAWTDIEKLFGDILIFALIAGAVVTMVDLIPKVPSVIKYVIKFGLVYAAFWFWMLDGDGVNGSQKLIMSTVYVVAYAVIAVLGAILKFVEKKLAVGETDYKSVYTEGKADDVSVNNEKQGNDR